MMFLVVVSDHQIGNNLDPKVKQIISGPLAAMVYATTSVKVARVPVLRIHNYFLVMPQQVDIHSRFTLPGIADTVLERPALDISLDGNDLYDSKLVTSWTGNHVAITDGVLSESEKAMLKAKSVLLIVMLLGSNCT